MCDGDVPFGVKYENACIYIYIIKSKFENSKFDYMKNLLFYIYTIIIKF